MYAWSMASIVAVMHIQALMSQTKAAKYRKYATYICHLLDHCKHVLTVTCSDEIQAAACSIWHTCLDEHDQTSEI